MSDNEQQEDYEEVEEEEVEDEEAEGMFGGCWFVNWNQIFPVLLCFLPARVCCL